MWPKDIIAHNEALASNKMLREDCIYYLRVVYTILLTGYHLFGIRVIADLLNNKGWEASPFFPRVTLCDFKVSCLFSIMSASR